MLQTFIGIGVQNNREPTAQSEWFGSGSEPPLPGNDSPSTLALHLSCAYHGPAVLPLFRGCVNIGNEFKTCVLMIRTLFWQGVF